MLLAGWGCADSGQLGDESGSEIVSKPQVLPNLPVVGAVAAGLSSSVVVDRSGTSVVALPDAREVDEPYVLPAISFVAIGHDFVLYVSAAGSLLVSGSGGFGQLAHGKDIAYLPVPTVVPTLASVKIVEVAAGSMHWLALDSSSHVYACGHNASGQCGDGTTDNIFAPVCITALWASPVIHVSAGDRHSAVLTATGDIFCFGSNKFGQLGQPGFTLKLCALHPRRVAVPYLDKSVMLSRERDRKTFSKPPSLVDTARQHEKLDADGDAAMTSTEVDNEATEMMDAASEAAVPERVRPDLGMENFDNLFYEDVACGDMHTVALLSNGFLACWGLSENGQVGSRSTANAYAPVLIKPSDSVGVTRFVSVSAGARHSAAVTNDGRAFLWGDGSLGQIGDGDISDKLLPVPIRPPRLACRRQQNSERTELDGADSVFASEPASLNALSLRFVRIFCGAYHNLALLSDHDDSYCSREMYLSRIPLLDVDHIVAPISGLPRLGSVAVLVRTFVSPGWTNESPKLDAARVLKAHSSFASVFGIEGDAILIRSASKIRHEAQAAFGMLKGNMMEYFASSLLSSEHHYLVTPVDRLEGDEYFRCEVAEMREAGVALFLAFLNPTYCSVSRDRSREIAELISLVVHLRRDARNAFIACGKWCPAEILAKCFVRPLQALISDELRLKHRVTKRTTGAVRVLAMCHHANFLKREAATLCVESGCETAETSVIADEEFYNEAVSTMIDLKEDWERWRSGQSDENSANVDDREDDDAYSISRSVDAPFSFCEYSFLLNKVAKFKVLAIEARSSMENEAFRSLMSFGAIAMPYNFSHVANMGHLVLRVRRAHIVADTFQQLGEISSSDSRDLHKTLKVSFVGEEGLDEGGVRKEFFQVLTEQLFSADYGMFTYHEDTRHHWFRRDSLEEPGAFVLVGIAIGLAMFNSILLDIQFPSVIYRKLHGAFQFAHQNANVDPSEYGRSLYEPTLRDVMEVFPSIGNSLKHLFEYKGDDVEDVFGLTYEVPYEGMFGRAETAELVPEGASKSVTSKNKEEFVRRYVDYLIGDSIEVPFFHFAKGLIFMMNGGFVSQLTPDELETLVIGEKELDFEALRATCRYEGYTYESPTIQNLWTVLFELDTEMRQKFLSFVTGSDRAPIGGLGNLGLVIQRQGGDSDRLPTSHTCFNVLLLPDYSTRAKLRSLLLVAIQNSEGFGLR